MNFYNNYTSNNEISKGENIIEIYKKTKENALKGEERNLYNLFGYIPKKYLRYFNLLIIQIFATLFFALLYYILLIVDFDKHFFIQPGFKDEKLWNYKWFVAIYLSINFQTTTAYVDLKCKSMLVKSIILLQLITTAAIAFFFLIT
jgi:hypothetical protein